MRKLINIIRDKIAKFCCEASNITDEKKKAEIYYGAYHITQALVKAPIMFLPAILLGRFWEILIASVVFSVLRYFAGGVHAKTHEGCSLIGNMVMAYVPLILADLMITLNSNTTVEFNIKTIVMLVSLILIMSYAPADLENKPVNSVSRRIALKVGAIVSCCIFFIVSVLLPQSALGGIIIFEVLMESLSITPLAYKLFKNNYGKGYGLNVDINL